MTGPIVFDTEGHAIGEERAPGMTPERFIRLAGWSGFEAGSEVHLTTDIPAFRELLRSAPMVGGHNILAHDLPRLGFSRTEILDMARQQKILDGWVMAPMIDQPANFRDVRRPDVTVWINGKDGRPDMGRLKALYRLDNLAFRYGHAGKTLDLRKFATEHGTDDEGRPLNGECCVFAGVPIDHPEFVEYLRQDVRSARGVLSTLVTGAAPGSWDYYWREHRVAAAAVVIGENGFRCDHVLAQQRHDEGRKRANEHLDRLAERYGCQLVDAKGRPFRKPLSSDPGKAMLRQAIRETGLTEFDLPKTARTGSPSYGGKAFLELAEAHPENAAFAELANSVAVVQGERAVYGTALKHLWPDGMSHPSIFQLQRSGRWSTTDPGLTVFGKRGGRVIERAIYVSDVLPHEVEDLRDAHVLVSFDAAQIDARAVAVHAQDHAYMDLFEPGRDSHEEIAVAIWGDKSRREDGKPMHHGFNYGLGPKNMAKQAKVPIELAEEFHAGMRSQFPGLIAWQERVRDMGLSSGYVDNGFGRVMKVDPERAYTQAPALVGQGCARDLMMHGILRLPDEIICMIKAQIHDEIVLSIPIRYAREVVELIKATMSFEWAPPGASRPIRIEVDHGPFAFTWEGCYAK